MEDKSNGLHVFLIRRTKSANFADAIL